MRMSMTLVLASALGVAYLIGGPVMAQESSPRESVELLMPRLQSEDDAVREQAEKELFKLGESGRREMERLSRDTDTRRALTALRYLQSGRWTTSTLRDGEQPLERSDDDGSGRIADLERQMDARFEDLRKQLERALQDLSRGVPDWTPPRLPSMELTLPEEGGSITLQGTVTRGDRTLSWQRAADGSVTVTATDGTGEPQKFEAADMESFRATHPELAAELDELVPTWTGAPTVRVWDRVPEIRIPPAVWRWWHDEDEATDPAAPARTPSSAGPKLGVRWGPVSPLLRHHLRLGDVGVVVEDVLPDTLAARLRMQAMDILVELAGTPIRTRADIGAALRDPQRDPLDAVVIRAGERRTLRLPE